jgi:uncharacterized membrane protein
MIRISIPYLLTIIISVLLLVIGHNIAVAGMVNFNELMRRDISHETASARVQKIVERIERTEPVFDFMGEDFEYDYFNDDDYDFAGFFEMMPGDRIIFEAKVTRGPRRGEIITAEQSFSPLLLDRSKEVAKGDYVLLFNNNLGWYFNGYMRVNRLIALGVLFAILLLVFGGKKGFNTILSIGLTCAAIFAVFIPAVLSGKNIYVMSFLICAYIIITTPLIVMGYNKKSLAAVAGCAGGVIIAGITAFIMDKALYLTGIVDEHSRFLINLPGDIQLNLRAVIFAGIIIGAMGAIMDVSISLSSALWEIKEKAKTIKFRELLKSGINIGRDIMGTMADTLILAYIGSSLTIVLLLSVSSRSLFELFNFEMIAVEILQALAGSLGILFAMPLTALFCSLIYLKSKEKQ